MKFSLLIELIFLIFSALDIQLFFSHFTFTILCMQFFFPNFPSLCCVCDFFCMQDTFARVRDDKVFCIQETFKAIYFYFVRFVAFFILLFKKYNFDQIIFEI